MNKIEKINDCFYIKGSIIMLPSNKKAPLVLTSKGLFLTSETKEKGIYQHLYVLDKSNLKENYWYIKDNKILQADEKELEALNIYLKNNVLSTIIGATENLHFSSLERISNISKVFLHYYADRYNKNKPIKTVKIECIEHYGCKIGDKLEIKSDLYGYKKGEFITVKAFNHRNDYRLVEFEEDNEFNMGFHLGHLVHNFIFNIKLNKDKCLILATKQKKYSQKEMIKNMTLAYGKGKFGTTPFDLQSWIESII